MSEHKPEPHDPAEGQGSPHPTGPRENPAGTEPAATTPESPEPRREQQGSTTNPIDGPEAQRIANEPAKNNAQISPSRRTLWLVGGALGTYMIARGLYEMVTDSGQEP